MSVEEYNDKFCEAVDIIIAARLNELAFDKTIICTITDDTEKSFGKYTVTDGSTTFDAYSENENYFVNSKVLVLIPNGDWTQQKRITGEYISEDIPAIYIKPTDKITDLTGNLAGNKKSSIIANGDKQNVLLGKNSQLNLNASLHNRLCIKADFKTALGDYLITSGSYGIGVIINDNAIVELSSSKDMFGQVYNYFDYVSQEQVYAIPEDITTITSLEIYLYQDGDFQYKDVDGTTHTYDNKQGSIEVKNPNVFIGTDKTLDEGVSIYTNDNMMYSPADESLARIIHLVWNYKDSNGVSVDIGDSNIYWYVDEKLDNNQTGKREITIKCQPSQTFTSVRAEVQRGTELYKSNELRFENQLDKDSQVPLADIKLEIVNVKNAFDAYPFYNTKNEIIDKNEGSGYEDEDGEYHDGKIRTVKLIWSSSKGNVDNSYWKGAKIQWSIPQENTMLKAEAAWLEETDLYVEEDEENDYLNNEFEYIISDTFFDSYKDNTITCTITLADNKDYGNKQTQLVVTKSITFSQHPVNKDGEEISPEENITNATDIMKTYIMDEVIGKPSDPKASTIYSYINGLTYIEQEDAFNKLTNNGTSQGLFMQDENLYINGSYIATGILRSQNWDGTLTYHYEDENGEEQTETYNNFQEADDAVKDATKKASWTEGRWSLTASSGTYWNLNDGQIFADKFELNAWDAKEQKGLYMNNDPSDGGSYFSVGDSNGSFIQFMKGNEEEEIEDSLVIKANNFTLDAFETDSTNISRGIYLNSNPNENGYWFIIGEGPDTDGGQNNFIQMDKEGNFTIQTNGKFVLNAWKLVDEDENIYQGVYINSNAKDDGALNRYFQIGNSNNYIMYSTDGLEMQIPSSKIILVDDNDNIQGLQGYIKITAAGAISEFTSGLGYFGTCSTENGIWDKRIKFDGKGEVYIPVEELIEGFTMTITFLHEETRKEDLDEVGGYRFVLGVIDGDVKWSAFCSVQDEENLTWSAGERLTFTLIQGAPHYKFALASVSKSYVEQTSENITASVSETYLTKEGYNATKTFGWNLTSDGFYLGTNEKPNDTNGYVMKVNEEGLFIKGHIEATSGTIGNFKVYSEADIQKYIDSGGKCTKEVGLFGALTGETSGFGIMFDARPSLLQDSSSSKAIGIGYIDDVFADWDGSGNSGLSFYVRADGYLYSNKGNIGGININNGNLSAGGFKIESTGHLTCTSATIGGWTLAPVTNSTGTSIWGYSLKSGTEGSDGFIGLWTAYPDSSNYRLRIGSKFSVTSDGALYASAGKIGDWQIAYFDPSGKNWNGSIGAASTSKIYGLQYNSPSTDGDLVYSIDQGARQYYQKGICITGLGIYSWGFERRDSDSDTDLDCYYFTPWAIKF